MHLKAGDGVVYANMILHWASNYSAKMRRCIHLGDRGFGSQLFYPNGFVDHENITCYLAPEKRARYARLLELYRGETISSKPPCAPLSQEMKAAFARALPGCIQAQKAALPV